MTTSKPKRRKRKPATSSKSVLGRVQATLPGARRNAEKSGARKGVAAFGRATSSPTDHKPSTKSLLGILAGGLGAAAVVKRRHGHGQDQAPVTHPRQPTQTLDTTTPRIVETRIEPTAVTGGGHGDLQGPDPAVAA
jgi:hypothetical protein